MFYKSFLKLKDGAIKQFNSSSLQEANISSEWSTEKENSANFYNINNAVIKIFYSFNLSAMFKNTFLFVKTKLFVVN